MSPSRQERAQAKRRQILDAARTRFLEAGVAQTSVDSICATAGVSKQTVYAYYADKDALLRAVLESLVDERIRAAPDRHREDPIHEVDDLRAALLDLAVETTEALTDPAYLATARILIHEAVREPDYGEAFATAVAQPVLQAVWDTLERADAGGVLRTMPAPGSPRLLVGGLLTYTLLDGLLRPHDVRRPARDELGALVEEYVGGLPLA